MSDQPPVDALVLRSVDFSDSDRVVTLFTREEGKATFMAKGARASKKRFGGALQPFARLRVELRFGRSGMGTLKSAQLVEPHLGLLRDLRLVSAAGAVLEDLREVVPERQPEPALFDDTDACLSALAAIDQAGLPLTLGPVLLRYLSRLFTHLGVQPELHACMRCGKAPRAGQAALVDLASGGIVCRGCGGGQFLLSGPVRDALLAGEVPVERAGIAAAFDLFDGLFQRQFNRALAMHRVLLQERSL